MKKPILILFIFLLLSTKLFASERIISLAPALTDIVIKLGEADKLVGVTDYCVIPKKYEKNIVRMGGYINPSFERLLRMKPTKVFLYKENQKMIKFLKKMNIFYLALPHKTFEDVYFSINKISFALKCEQKGKLLIQKMKKELSDIKKDCLKYKRQKVLFVISRAPGNLKNIYIVGNGDFFSTIYDVLNIENVYHGDVNYPKVSIDSIMKMDPDIIVEVLTGAVLKYGKKRLLADWERYKFLRAVKNGHLYEMDGDFRIIPAPEVIDNIKKLKKIICND